MQGRRLDTAFPRPSAVRPQFGEFDRSDKKACGMRKERIKETYSEYPCNCSPSGSTETTGVTGYLLVMLRQIVGGESVPAIWWKIRCFKCDCQLREADLTCVCARGRRGR